jgi:hypothetical protein
MSVSSTGGETTRHNSIIEQEFPEIAAVRETYVQLMVS